MYRTDCTQIPELQVHLRGRRHLVLSRHLAEPWYPHSRHVAHIATALLSVSVAPLASRPAGGGDRPPSAAVGRLRRPPRSSLPAADLSNKLHARWLRRLVDFILIGLTFLLFKLIYFPKQRVANKESVSW